MKSSLKKVIYLISSITVFLLVVILLYTYLASDEIDVPTVYPDSGTYERERKVTIYAPKNADNAVIYYTLDGTDPMNSSTRLLYTRPFILYQSTTLKLYALLPDGRHSSVQQYNYVIDLKSQSP